MEQKAETGVPNGATHTADFYGQTLYYQQVDSQHMNQVAEEWQTLTRWNVWERGAWVDVGSGFSSRRLQKLDLGESQSMNDGAAEASDEQANRINQQSPRG